MQAIDVMSRNVTTVDETDSVQRAAQLMLDAHVSGLPVTAFDGTLVGIVTEGDLIHRVENDTDRVRSLFTQVFTRPATLKSEFRKATGRRVRDVMTPAPVTVAETTLLWEIAELFDRHQIKRVPVTHNGHLVGIVSRADLLRALVGSNITRAGDMDVVDFR